MNRVGVPRCARPLLGFLAGALLLLEATLWAFPEPDIVPKSWELEFRSQTPALIAFQGSRDKQARLYWYMTYSVINKTAEDRLFVPDIWMLTDAGDLLQANRGVPPQVFRHIQKHLRNPLLESPSDVVGRLLQGADHARDGVAIWPVPDHDVDEIRIFFGGLSGETHQVVRITAQGDTSQVVGTYPTLDEFNSANEEVRQTNDQAKELDPDISQDKFKAPAQADILPSVLRKTLLLEYQLPGDASHVRTKPFVFKSKRWVVR